MEKKAKMCLIYSLIGILFLFIASSILSPEVIGISQINDNMLDRGVSIIANITSVKSYNNETFFVFTAKDDSGNITVIASSDNNLKEYIILNRTYFITGKLEEYNNTPQISAGKIILKK